MGWLFLFLWLRSCIIFDAMRVEAAFLKRAGRGEPKNCGGKVFTDLQLFGRKLFRTARFLATSYARLVVNMSSFFTLPTSQRKRKRTEDTGRTSKRRGQEDARSRSAKKVVRARDPGPDSSISGSDSDDDPAPEPDLEYASDSSATSAEDEDPADRRVRLAQRYLNNLRVEIDEAGFDA